MARGGDEDGGGEEEVDGEGNHRRDGKGKGKGSREGSHGVASTVPGDVVVEEEERQHPLDPHGPNGGKAKFLQKKPKEDPWRESETSGATA